MPSFQIHLAVAKLYIQKNDGEITNQRDFYNGSIAPDLTDNKMKTHYSLPPSGDDFVLNLQNKVDLNQLYKLPIDNDFEKGVFLHLLADYIFYNYYYSLDFLRSTTYEEFSPNLYASYDFSNDWVNNTYGTDKLDTSFAMQMQQSIKDMQTAHPDIGQRNKNLLADTEKLARFIDFVASMNLKKIKDDQNIGEIYF